MAWGRALGLEKWLFTAGPVRRQVSRENEDPMHSIISEQHLFETGSDCFNQKMQGWRDFRDLKKVYSTPQENPSNQQPILTGIYILWIWHMLLFKEIEPTLTCQLAVGHNSIPSDNYSMILE